MISLVLCVILPGTVISAATTGTAAVVVTYTVTG